MTERECLGVIWAIQILRPYLDFKRFELFTDHSSLKWHVKITEPGIRLSHWRLIPAEFDFEVKYRKGDQNHVAGAISRLWTYEYHAPDAKVDMLAFLIEESTVTDKFPLIHEVDLPSWTKQDWGPYNDSEDQHILKCRESFSALAVDMDSEISAVNIDEVHEAQEEEPECRAIRKEIETIRNTPFIED